MPLTLDTALEGLQTKLREAFPKVMLEFAVQIFANHVELLVYVLDMKQYESVRARCNVLSKELEEKGSEPEIWILARTWTGPWPGGESEQELRDKLREDFKRKHSATMRS